VRVYRLVRHHKFKRVRVVVLLNVGLGATHSISSYDGVGRTPILAASRNIMFISSLYSRYG
jgi:hypothetical protein